MNLDSKLKLLYDNVSQHFELGDYESFKSKMANPEKRKLFYDNVGQVFELGDYESFTKKIMPEISIPPIGYVTESVENITQSESGKKEDVTLKVKDFYNFADNLKNVVYTEAEPASTTVKQEDKYNQLTKESPVDSAYQKEDKPSIGKSVVSGIYNVVGGLYGAGKMALEGSYWLASQPQNALAKIFNIDELETDKTKLYEAFPVIEKAMDIALPAQQALDYAQGLSSREYFDKDMLGYIKDKDYKNFGKLLGYQVIENLPQQAIIWGSALLTGNPLIGTAIISGQAAGGKYETINKDLPEYARFANALSTGMTEYLTESYLGTVPILKSLMGRDKRLLKAGMKEAIKDYAKTTGKAFTEEGFEETVAQFTENLIDILSNNRDENGNLPGLFDGVTDATFIGGVTGGLLGAGGTAITRTQASEQLKSQKEIKELAKKLNIPEDDAIRFVENLQTEQPKEAKPERVELPAETQPTEIKPLSWSEFAGKYKLPDELKNAPEEEINNAVSSAYTNYVDNFYKQQYQRREEEVTEPATEPPVIEKPTNVELETEKMTPELEGIKKTNPMLFKFAQKSTSIDEFIDKVVEYNKTTKENVSIPALTDFYNKVKGSTKEVTKGAEEIKPEVKPIPEKLEPLAKEAMKYKDAKEFEEAVKYLQRADVPEKGTVSSRTYNLLKSLDEDDKYAIDIKKFGFKSFTDFYNQAVKGTKETKPEEKPIVATESQQPKTGGTRYNIVEIPLSDINVDVKSYQNRGEAFSQETYDSIMRDIRSGEFDWKRYKPIVLWRNPSTGKLDLLEGHSRKAAFEQAVKEGYKEFETIPSFIAEGGTAEEARKFAIEKSNVGQTREKDYERAKIYSEYRNKGMSKKDILAKARELEGRNAPYIIRLSYLNPHGYAINLIETFEDTADKSAIGLAEKIADWLGRAREKYPELTDSHENEIFKWLYGDDKNTGTALRFNTAEQFLDRVDAVVNRIDFEPDKPLNIANLAVKSMGELQHEEEIAKIEKELGQAHKRRVEIESRLSEMGLTPDDISKNEVYRQAVADVVTLDRELEQLRLRRSDVRAEAQKQTNIFDTAIKLTNTELKKEGLTDEEIRKTEDTLNRRTEQEIANLESKIETIEAQEKSISVSPETGGATGEGVRTGIKPTTKQALEKPEAKPEIKEEAKQTEPKKLTVDQRRAVAEIEMLNSTINKYDKISKSPNLAEGKKDEIRIAREKAIERIDYLNKVFNLGEGKTEVIPKKPAKILVKEISNNKQTISTLQNQKKSIVENRNKYKVGTEQWNNLDNKAKEINNKINELTKSMAENRAEVLGVNKPPKDRKTMLAYAHILERDAAKRGIDYTHIKQNDIGVKSLKDATDHQINDYINKLKPIPITVGQESVRKTASESLSDQELEPEAVFSRISRKTKQSVKSYADLTSNFLESMEHALNTNFGEATKEFVRLKREAELEIAKKVNPLLVEFERLYSKIPIKERNVLRNIIENPDAIKHSAEAQQFIDWYRPVDNEIFEAGKIINPEVKYIENHFQLVLKPDAPNLDLDSEYGKKVVRIVAKNLRIKTNVNVTEAQAKEYLIKYFNDYKKHGYSSLYGVFIDTGSWKHDYPLEFHRFRILPEIFYENNVPNVLYKYIYNSWESIEYARKFGKVDGEYKYAKIDDMLKRVEAEGYDAELARDMIATVLHLKSFSHAEQLAVKLSSDITTFLLSPKTTIKNIGDLNKSIALTNSKSLLEYYIKSAVNAEERQLAKDIIGSKTIFQKSLEEAGITGKLADAYTKIILFQKSEKFIRKSTAMAAIHYCEHIVNNYNPEKPSAYLQRKFDYLSRGLNIEEVKKAGGLTRDQKLRIGLNAISITQPTSALDKPYYWEAKASGQIMTRYKPFGFKSLRFVKDYCLKELAKGNFLPFLRWVAWGIAFGYGIDQLTQFIFPKDDEDERQTASQFAIKLVKDFVTSGHLGFLGDLVFWLQYPGWYGAVVGTIFGPTVSLIVDNTMSVSKSVSYVTKGMPEPLSPVKLQVAKYTVKRVPFVGEKWYKEIKDEIDLERRLRGY